MFDPVQPFVLLDDVATGRARLFTGLIETVTASHPAEVAPALTRLAEPGPWAGFIGYEAGYALEPRLAARARPAPPLLWFGRYNIKTILDGVGVGHLLGDGPAAVGDAEPLIDRVGYDARLARIKALIAGGDIYQANLTFPATVACEGHPLHLYRRLRAGSRAPYGALIHTGNFWILSFSPELFFRLDGRQLTARPMKGTAARGVDAEDDAVRAAALAADPKNRAENLMIVDLLRNDLSRVATAVAVPELFAVETYPTVLQMTSTVTATARPGVGAADALAAIFPCGSITGAPKIRAMEVIAEVEPEPRGVYTGAIGAISANGDAVFSVAIRTLTMAGGGPARLGLGSGIVADSEAGSEWDECLAKAAFLTRAAPPDLIETMCVEAEGIVDLDRHLARMAASAAFLGHRFDDAAIRAALANGVAVQAHSGPPAPFRLRLLLAPSGEIAVQLSPLARHPSEPVAVALTPHPVTATDWRLRHKTTDRSFYDDARRASGAFECLLVHEDGQITEGSFTNIFVPWGGRLATPPLALGLLPGILRQRLIETGEAFEAPLTAANLAEGFFIGNALRGLIPARLG